MTTKEMIDDLLKRGKIEPNEHISLQLSMAGEKVNIIEEKNKIIMAHKNRIRILEKLIGCNEEIKNLNEVK